MDQNFPTIIMDCDNLVREGLRLILAKTPFHPQICGSEFEEIKTLPHDKPVVFILIVGQGDQFFEQISTIRERYPLSRIVILANDSQSDCLASALEAGANAALLTSITPEGLIKSLHALICDEVVVVDAKLWASAVCAKSVQDISVATQNDPVTSSTRQLSVRELQVLDRIILGDSNKHIARHFDIAEATVKAHLKAILRKIGASNRTSAAIWAVNNKLIDPPGTSRLQLPNIVPASPAPLEGVGPMCRAVAF